MMMMPYPSANCQPSPFPYAFYDDPPNANDDDDDEIVLAEAEIGVPAEDTTSPTDAQSPSTTILFDSNDAVDDENVATTVKSETPLVESTESEITKTDSNGLIEQRQDDNELVENGPVDMPAMNVDLCDGVDGDGCEAAPIDGDNIDGEMVVNHETLDVETPPFYPPVFYPYMYCPTSGLPINGELFHFWFTDELIN